jgi:hypothetical protein
VRKGGEAIGKSNRKAKNDQNALNASVCGTITINLIAQLKNLK